MTGSRSTGPLGVPAFRRMWLAGFVSEIGDWVLLVALPVYVYQRTGSTAATATTFVVALLPSLALSPLAGVLADRWDRRRLMLVVSLAQAVTLLPLLTGDLVLVNVVTAVQAGLAALFEPAKNALLPTLVPRELVTAANGLVGLNTSLARLVGASLGGVLLGYAGLPGVVLADAASFLLAAGLLVALRTPVPVRAAGKPAWRAWLDGLREIRGPLRPMVAVVGLMATSQGLFVVLFVVFVTERLGGGAAEVGFLRGVQAVGGVLGGLLVGVAARKWAPDRLLGVALLAFGVVAAIGWNAPHLTTALVFYLAAFAVAGAPGVAAGAGMMTVLQLHTAEEVRGRVLATFVSLYDAAQALGMVLAGVLTPVLGLSVLLNAQAGLYLVAGVSALVCLTPSGHRGLSGPARPAHGTGAAPVGRSTPAPPAPGTR